jgi:hypothetical protein
VFKVTVLTDFFMACLIMGLGIGIDVAIATFLRANAMQNKKTLMLWVVGVTCTHTLFPMFGYFLTYFSLQSMPVLTPIIGLLAFVMIAYFLMGELKSYYDSENKHIIKNETEKTSFIGLGLILAVSWDALWSGPAKSAQVLNWSDWMIWLSFILVGVVVLLFCFGSVLLANTLGHTMAKRQPQSQVINYGLWVQYSVFTYFGLLALTRYTLALSLSWTAILLFSFILMFMAMRLIQMKASTTLRTQVEC